MTSAEVLALFKDDLAAPELGRRHFYVPSGERDGGSGGRERAGGIIVHQPAAAVLLPSDLPPLSRRRPDFPALRHVLVRFGFMLDRLPPRHAYVSATLSITLDQPGAVVLAQSPSLVTTRPQTADSTTTDLSASLEGLAKLSAQRTRVTQETRSTSLPLVTAENRGSDGFGWHFEAQSDEPLLPHVETVRAVIELPRDITELTGTVGSAALVSFPRYGVFTKSEAIPLEPALPFRLPLGSAG